MWLSRCSACNHTLPRSALALLLLPFAVPHTLALLVVGGSNCTSVCFSPQNVYNTNGSDVVCHDTDYNSTSTGVDFEACVSCEIQSQAIPLTGSESDLGWAFFNMRYALDWCLFNFPQGDNETASNQCIPACGKISNALKTNLLNITASSTYDFCQDSDFLPNVGSCASCYKTVPNQLYLSNYLETLEYACQSQASPALPFPVKPSDIFTYHPPSNFSNLGAGGTSSHGISHDARVAIAISVPVAVFLIFSLLLVYLYVLRNAPSDFPRRYNRHSTRQTNYNEKHVSKSTSGWSKTSPRKGGHSRNISANSAAHQVTYPAPLKPSKVAVPAPLRTRNSPIPFSRNYYQPTNYGLEQPSKPPPPAIYTPEMLPATKYSPPRPRPPSLEPPKPHSDPSKAGLVSWERIAIQNAQIRAEQGPSPSPVSPLTRVQVVPVPKSPSLRSSSLRSSGSKRERFPVRPASSASSAAAREERHGAFKSPTASEQTRHSALRSPISREETHPALRSPTLSEEMQATFGDAAATEPGPDAPRREESSQDGPPPSFNRGSPVPLFRQGSLSRQSTPFRQERQEAQDMVDWQERQQQQRMGKIPEREGPERENEGQESQRSVRGSGSRDGVMRTGSGKSIMEKGGARKEVRWSKDVDYEG